MAVNPESFEGAKSEFTIIDQLLKAVRLYRTTDGRWHIEIVADLDIAINDGSNRLLVTGKQKLLVRAIQQGSKPRKKKRPASRENNKTAKTLMESLDQADLLKE